VTHDALPEHWAVTPIRWAAGTEAGQFQSAGAIFFGKNANFPWTPHRSMRNHHGQEEGFLILPCDWRFLPKLGPLRS
jgi:hypothetical protein